MAARKRIRRARVLTVSLCNRGKNALESRVVAEDAETISMALEFADSSTQESADGSLTLYAIVAAAEMPLPVRDDIEAIPGREAVREMVHSFMANGAVLDLNHDLQRIDKSRAYVAECMQVSAGDARFSNIISSRTGLPVDTDGAFGMVVKLLDPDLVKNYKTGGWKGVSLFGVLDLEPASLSEPAMNEEQLKALLAGFQASIEKGITAALAAKAEPEKETKPQGETLTTAQAVMAQAKKLREAAQQRRAAEVLAQLSEDSSAEEMLRVAEELETLGAPAAPKGSAVTARLAVAARDASGRPSWMKVPEVLDVFALHPSSPTHLVFLADDLPTDEARDSMAMAQLFINDIEALNKTRSN